MSWITITLLAVIALSLKFFKGEFEKNDKKYLIAALIALLVFFFLVSYDRAVPTGMVRTKTTVEDEYGHSYNLKVDICAEKYEDIDYDDSGTIISRYVAYKPYLIYWPNGGYSFLDPDDTEYTQKANEFVYAVSYSTGQRYKILIPKVKYSFYEKLNAISAIDLILYSIAFAMGITTLWLIRVKEKGDKSVSGATADLLKQSRNGS